MKKKFLLLMAAGMTLGAQAQGPNLVGTTQSGGPATNNGSVYKYTGGNNAISSATDMAGFNTFAGVSEASNGKLYGTTEEGGPYSDGGTLYEYDYATGQQTVLYVFGANGSGIYPFGTPLQASNGKLYGTANAGGVNGGGTLWSYDLRTQTYTDLVSLGAGADPYSSLIQASNGKLYGVTAYDGANSGGTIFEYNIATSAFAVKYDLPAASQPRQTMIEVSPGTFYGFCSGGGSTGSGYLYKYELSSNALTDLVDFPSGAFPTGIPLLASDGQIYGTLTYYGQGNGSIFSYNINTAIYTDLYDFTGGADGRYPNSIMQASDGNLYGETRNGGATDQGVIYQYNIATATFTKEVDYTTSTGYQGGFGKMLEYKAINLWTGAVSTNWNTAGNWTIGVPSCSQDATISGGASRYPVISGTCSVDNITITQGGSITIAAGQQLSVCGSWSNMGTASVGAGAVALQGTASKISGYTSFANLIMTGGSYNVGSTGFDKVDVRGILNLAGGTLNTSDKLTLKSTATQTALVQDNGGAISGNATVERYITGASGYHQISSPVSGATVSSISGMTISGTDGLASATPGKEGSLEVYRENQNYTSSLNNGYYNYTGAADPLTSGMGLSAKVTGASTIKIFGSPATGPINTTITASFHNPATYGWNLVGNPYPSPISWSAIKAGNPPYFTGTCYIWKPTSATAGTWQAYNGTAGTNGVGDVIAAGQGFFIDMNFPIPAVPMTFNNTMRTQSLTAVSYKTNAVANQINLTLTDASDNAAEALTYTEAGRSEGYDADADGIMPAIDGLNGHSIAFASQGQKYLINVVGSIDEATEMPLAIHTTDAGTYTIAASTLNVSGMPVYLLNSNSGTYTDLSTSSATITSRGNEDVSGYSVVFSKKADIAAAPSTSIYSTTGAIIVSLPATQSPATIVVTNMLGQQIVNTTTSNSTITLPIDMSDAIYIVSVKQAGIETVKKVFVK